MPLGKGNFLAVNNARGDGVACRKEITEIRKFRDLLRIKHVTDQIALCDTDDIIIPVIVRNIPAIFLGIGVVMQHKAVLRINGVLEDQMAARA